MALGDTHRSQATEELLAALRERSTAGRERFDPQVLELKEEIVQRNIGLVKSIAREFTHSGEPFDELVQAGYMGLLNAVANFELGRGLKFSTYATHLIKGEIRHHIRNKYLIRVPDWLKQLSEQAKRAQDSFYLQHGRFPTIRELSQRLNLKEEGIAEVLKARESMNYVSIDAEKRAEDPQPQIDVSKIQSVERRGLPLDYRIRIALAIEKLTAVQQRVIRGLFYSRKTQQEVAVEIGYSQRHISRIKEESLRKIKQDLEQNP